MIAQIGLICLGVMCASGGKGRHASGSTGQRGRRSKRVGSCRGRGPLNYATANVGSRRRGRNQLRAEKGLNPCASPQSTYPEPQGQDVPASPWLSNEVNDAMVNSLQSGVRDAPTLTNNALQQVYPTAPDGTTHTWPCTGSDCPSKLALESRVALRAELIAAEQRDMDADELWTAGGGY